MFISWIFPCFNEELAIPVFLPKIILAGKHILKTTDIKGLEILMVDVVSTDRSLELLQKHQGDIEVYSSFNEGKELDLKTKELLQKKPKQLSLNVLCLKTQEGYGSAIQKGIQKAKGDWLAFCDLDDTCKPEDLKNLIELAQQNQSLLVLWGNRLHKNSQMPFIRQLGNRLYQLAFLFLSFCFVPDPCSGFRLFKKSALVPQIYKFPKDLSFSLALTAYCVRYNIGFSCVDIYYKNRLGLSKLKPFKDGFAFLLNLVNFLFFKKF